MSRLSKVAQAAPSRGFSIWGAARRRARADVPCGGPSFRSFASHDTPNPVLPLRIVSSRPAQRIVPLFGNLGYAFLAAGFLMTDVLELRTLLVGGYASLVCYHALQLRPLRIPLAGSFFFVCVNAFFVVKIINERFVWLDEEETAIYSEHFDTCMSKHQFKLLMRQGEIRTVKDRLEMIRLGELSDLILILDGSGEVSIGGDLCVTVGASTLLGEVSCLHGGAASSAASALPGCRYILWRREGLLKFLATEQEVKRGLELKAGRELSRKLRRSNFGLLQAELKASYHVVVLKHALQAMNESDREATCKELFDQLREYREHEGISDSVHTFMMQRLGIIEEEAGREAQPVHTICRQIPAKNPDDPSEKHFGRVSWRDAESYHTMVSHLKQTSIKTPEQQPQLLLGKGDSLSTELLSEISVAELVVKEHWG